MDITVTDCTESGREIGVTVSLDDFSGGFDFSVVERNGSVETQAMVELSLADVDGLISALRKARALYVAEQAEAA